MTKPNTNRFEGFISMKDLSVFTGKHLRWIQKISEELVNNGYGKKIGGTLICHEGAIEYINVIRPETRGSNFMGKVGRWDLKNGTHYVRLKSGWTFSHGTHNDIRGFSTQEKAIKAIKASLRCTCMDCEIDRL